MSQIQHILKIALLLARFFYQHRELNLPGIGSFFLDKAVSVPDVTDKNFREFLKYIQFSQKPVLKPDEVFIDFIRAQTGKIRPLAESDLESYLADGKLLLNIGKPFHIEGIGSLQKNKSGQYEFTPGEPMLERFESLQEEKDHEKHPRRKPTYDESQHRTTVHNTQRRVLLIGTLGVIALAIILWGGYSLYTKKAATSPATSVAVQDTAPVADTPKATTPPIDSNALAVSKPGIPPGHYKFIFETTAKKSRALYRYEYVKKLSPTIQLETTDSSLFNITVTLPGTPADTTWLKDSLNAWYYGTRPIKVRIEPNGR